MRKHHAPRAGNFHWRRENFLPLFGAPRPHRKPARRDAESPNDEAERPELAAPTTAPNPPATSKWW